MLTQEQINERLDDIWEFANGWDITRGVFWYPNARSAMHKHGFDSRDWKDCCTIAIAAWNNTWKNTVTAAVRLVLGGGSSAQKAIMKTYLNQRKHPKSYDFAMCLLGYSNIPPIDRWMFRAMGSEKRKHTVKEYMAYQWAFIRWYDTLNTFTKALLSVSAMQAVIWCTIRGKGD